jgi:hypothetical protein
MRSRAHKRPEYPGADMQTDRQGLSVIDLPSLMNKRDPASVCLKILLEKVSPMK